MLILNEPVCPGQCLANDLTKTPSQAGKVAQVMVQHTVKLVVHAWFDNRVNPDEIISQVFEVLLLPACQSFIKS